MRKLFVAVAAAACLVPLAASARPIDGAASLYSQARNFTPIEEAACQGWGRWCPPGYVRACGPYRCWCRPCR
ncbi:hypothetical protein WOC76_06160 [Methylocystis sp. IM3]|jgi:hypothetical protein|uniref:hypothetical protein n=1 Tax=unclassified Methylocystis TaxID=2625913 RepID=UPI000F992061|nr:MAG: hypothetical protein EKK29_13510 [Hyphomicrobiales bacterium]